MEPGICIPLNEYKEMAGKAESVLIRSGEEKALLEHAKKMYRAKALATAIAAIMVVRPISVPAKPSKNDFLKIKYKENWKQVCKTVLL